MPGLKVVVIGGGSSYTPELIDGFIRRAAELPTAEICLVDIPDGQKKVRIVADLARRMVDKAGLATEITISFDRQAALSGADFVVTQFRVGGLDARARDERFPLPYGVLGQETTGPGGFAKALRTMPVILAICRDMAACCPDAWLINFTNPAGLITETVLKHSRIKCIGLCNVPIHMKMNIAKLLEADPHDIFIDFAGLNHLVWGRTVWHKGIDVTAGVLDKMLDGAALTMKNIPNLKWDGDFLKSLGMLPCPYHRYYYMTDDMLAEEQAAAAPGGGGTRAEVVKKVEERLFQLYQDPQLAEKPAELEKRGGAYYSDAAVSLISAIFNDKREIHTVNTSNRGAISDLPDDCVIETNCVIGKNGALPLTVGKLPPELAGLVQHVKAYEILAVEAGVRGDRGKALQALANHPLVPSVGVAKQLLADLLKINAVYLPQFRD
ncbi:6-phospho-beta-glucosidase [Sporomusa acidovorans]|uniref:6-phospho-beta-glucosidase n=1 Tax=Sporomusa acidovorans (strain ATCC 49682 / DSM 3132 / Mol) TaxID=1123286 RepID=A0ABZ3JBA6_SPOA4|nr:6-phospho-beta-glucosidase [Sporomusa acidovorans]OZC21748.1 putative 6-phospho-beta-glucosidase [Sporomusa acidovorans DSM 3132]SDD58267.1 6-phospho-beta-glucosidase [Sporomusa acidovorans]